MIKLSSKESKFWCIDQTKQLIIQIFYSTKERNNSHGTKFRLYIHILEVVISFKI